MASAVTGAVRPPVSTARSWWAMVIFMVALMFNYLDRQLLTLLITPIKADLGIKRVRGDTFGYLQRCFPNASPVDQREARAAGRKAAEVALLGDLDGSVAIKRTRDEPYECRFELVKLDAVAGKTRHMPEEFIDGANNVSDAYLDYLRPLVGRLPETGRL